MSLYLGIDLGSTTTKAVVLDESLAVLGKGITNSRSNYDTACAIAKTEAFVDTRFSLFHRRMEAVQGLQLDVDEFLTALEARFRQQQFLGQLESLAETAIAEAHEERYAAQRKPLVATLNGMFDEIGAQSETLFAVGSPKRSDFFRDLANAAYMELAAERSSPNGVTYDTLVNIFDKCIIRVENQMLDLGFAAHIRKALKRALSDYSRITETTQRQLQQIVDDVADTELSVIASVGTGYGRARLPFPKEQIRSEILCHGLGAHYMYPATATVLDIGGQDTKAIQVDEHGIVTSFQMNDRCAAGCGRYLGYIADELNLGVQELGPLAMQASKSVRINSTCTVFAGAELRERLNNGERREDILQGLHRAIILRAMSLLARSGGVADEFTFTGGVANNAAAVNALRGLVTENYGERTLNISPNSIYTGAIGAALFAQLGDAAPSAAAS